MTEAIKKARAAVYDSAGSTSAIVRITPALTALCAAYDTDLARVTAALEETLKSHALLCAYRDACDELEAAQAEAGRCLTKKRSAWDIAKSELIVAEKKHADALAALRGK